MQNVVLVTATVTALVANQDGTVKMEHAFVLVHVRQEKLVAWTVVFQMSLSYVAELANNVSQETVSIMLHAALIIVMLMENVVHKVN